MLTNAAIKAANPQAKPFTMPDSHGLYLLIKPNNSKLWRFQYQYQGKPRLMALGQYPETSLAMARTAHAAARIELAKGIDPGAQRKTQKQAAKAQVEAEQRIAEKTFKAVALKWHEWYKAGVDAETAAYILRRLDADVFPVFGNKPIDAITAKEIRELVQAIEKRARDVAQRQLGTISQIFRYAVTHDLAERNPAADFKPSDVFAPHKTQHRAHIEPAHLPALLVAMNDYDGHAVVHFALKLMALTFVRTVELLEAPWTEFDLDNARWVITPERMKMDKPHIVPLSRQAVEVLRELKQLAGTKRFVFPGMNKQSANGTINCNSLLNALDDIGYKGVMTGHGYRGLASTILHEHGFEEAHIDLQLSHSKKNKVAASYDHAKYLSQRTELMQWWADYLDVELAKGRTTILPIRQDISIDASHSEFAIQ